MTTIRRLSRADFSVLRPLLKEHGRFFTLTVAKSPDSKARFACVVSKKTERRAHERNLIKRRCRAAIRETTVQLPYALVFTAKRAVIESSYQEIVHEVSTLLEKATTGLNRTRELQ